MTNTLYVGNLPYDTTEEDLVENFGQIGTCLSATIIRDRNTGVSKGYAFVAMASKQEAQEAIQKCKGVELDGRKLIVSEARAKKDKKHTQRQGFKGNKRL